MFHRNHEPAYIFVLENNPIRFFTQPVLFKNSRSTICGFKDLRIRKLKNEKSNRPEHLRLNSGVYSEIFPRGLEFFLSRGGGSAPVGAQKPPEKGFRRLSPHTQEYGSGPILCFNFNLRPIYDLPHGEASKKN